MALWDYPAFIGFNVGVDTFMSHANAHVAGAEFPKFMSILHQARQTLRMKTVGPVAASFDQGRPYDYFEEVRQIVASAQKDLLFVDRYLEAEFVKTYCTQVKRGVTIRLLTSHALTALLPAVELLARQNGSSIEVRESVSQTKPHDRYLFVDGTACYASTASFKDGARKAPAIFVQMVDLFADLQRTYEAEWSAAAVRRAPR